mgnify:CR=1 FL=1
MCIRDRSWAHGGTVFGHGSLWALRFALDGGPVLRPDGTYVISKLPWYVLPPGGKPALTGRRVDGPGVFRADSNVAFEQGTYFATSSLDFSTVGCWQVTARYHGTTLRFPVLVRARTPSS